MDLSSNSIATAMASKKQICFPTSCRGKRKNSDISNENKLQSKKYISESQMIKHISQLHISDNEDSTPDSESSEEEDCHHETLPRLRYDLSQNTFKNKLSQQLNNVKKITIAEQFKSRLRMDDDLLFAKILKHANTEPFSSCRSLVVWKPPPVSLDNILPVHSSKAEDKNGRGTKLPPPPPAMEIDEM